MHQLLPGYVLIHLVTAEEMLPQLQNIFISSGVIQHHLFCKCLDPILIYQLRLLF